MTQGFFILWPCLLAVISLAFQGESCELAPKIDESPSNASVLQGSNHTFWCKGNGSSITIDWESNGTQVYKLPEDSRIVPVDVSTLNDDCSQESGIVVHAKSVPEGNTLSIFTIRCVLKDKKELGLLDDSEAFLSVYVIGGAGDVELVSPASPNGPAILQWTAPDVLSGSSSPLYYNITVRDPSEQTIAQNTTTDTSFAIDSDLLVPCHSCQLAILPFQHNSSHTELGILTQETLFPPPLPPTNVSISVSVGPDSAWVTIHFQVQHTNCSLQKPENFIVAVMQQGTNATEAFQSAKQPAMGMENKYTLENLNLRQKYQVSIKLGKNISSSVAETAYFVTFNVQNLTLSEQGGGRELNVHCEMAKGAEDKNCTVTMRNETGVLPQSCFSTGGRNATCELTGLALGQYVIQGYDREYQKTPAVEHTYLFTGTMNKESTNTPTARTDDTTTLESSTSRLEDEEAVKTDLIVGIVAAVTFFVTVGLVSIIVAIVAMKLHRKKRKYPLRDDVAHTEEYIYPTAEENAYAEHNILRQQDTVTVSTVVQEPGYAEAQTPGNAHDEHGLSWQQNAGESTGVQEPAYADVQTVISTTATTHSSHNQCREHRKEWLVHLPPEEPTSPDTSTFSHHNLMVPGYDDTLVAEGEGGH